MESPPAIAALFVIRFDIKAGYFVHDQYAGISAFVNHPAEEAERNAKMFAIGVLVPLASGRLGKSWRHAPKLKELAQSYATDMSNTQALSEYWEAHEIRDNDASNVPPESPLESPLSFRLRAHGERPESLRRSRAFSDAIVLDTPRPALTPFHPASSLPDFLDSKHHTPQAVHLKATQRDARRYATLRRGLRQSVPESDAQTENSDSDSDAASTYSSSPVVEPISWARLAYSSFIWWASAGEKREGLSEDEEEEHQLEQDTRLLASVDTLPSPPSGSGSRRSMHTGDTSQQQPPEIALVAYFRRLTAQIFVTLSDVIARHDSRDGEDPGQHDGQTDASYQDEPEDDTEPSVAIGRQTTQEDESSAPLLGRDAEPTLCDDDEPVRITTEDMTEMGLDVWSGADRVFVEELVRSWWGRKAYVDSARIRCCGISII
ncbi:hypothetical protein ATERTT37_001373 [Aspergillus terreus]